MQFVQFNWVFKADIGGLIDLPTPHPLVRVRCVWMLDFKTRVAMVSKYRKKIFCNQFEVNQATNATSESVGRAAEQFYDNWVAPLQLFHRSLDAAHVYQVFTCIGKMLC